MPTLTWLDSFEHQQTAATFYGTNAGVYDTTSNAAVMSFVTGRRVGSHALQMAQDGATQTRVGKTVAAGNRTLVESFYFKCSSAPAANSAIWTGMPSPINAVIRFLTDGTIDYTAGSGTQKSAGATNYADGAWHRLDLKWVTSATTFTLDIQIDGTTPANGQHVSNTTTAVDITESRLGSNNAGANATIAFADWVRSVTAGDYPIGPHKCIALIPDADGSHSWASTHMGDEGGGTTSSVTTLHNAVDDFSSGAADTTSYIAYTTTTATSTEYAEITLPDFSGTVWGARAVAAIFSGGTAANSATTRVVDGGGSTVLDLYVGDQSDTSLRHQAAMVPSITTDTALNALKWRVGFPTDSNPAPRWSALMIDYATLDTVDYTLSSTVANISFNATSPTPTKAMHLTSTVANITFGATSPTTTLGHGLTSTVANITLGATSPTVTKAMHLADTVANIAFSGGTDTASVGRFLTPAVANVTFTGGDHSMTYTPGSTGYTLTSTVANVSFGATSPTATKGVNLASSQSAIAFNATSLTTALTRYLASTFGTITFTGGDHAMITSANSNYTLASEAANVAFLGGEAGFLVVSPEVEAGSVFYQPGVRRNPLLGQRPEPPRKVKIHVPTDYALVPGSGRIALTGGNHTMDYEEDPGLLMLL